MAVKRRRNCRYCGAILEWDSFEQTYICPRCHWRVPRDLAYLWRLVNVQNAIDENEPDPVRPTGP